jgi:hypothetical protein
VSQHLVNGPSPFSRECIRQLLRAFLCRRAAAPHRGHRGLVGGIVRYEVAANGLASHRHVGVASWCQLMQSQLGVTGVRNLLSLDLH